MTFKELLEWQWDGYNQFHLSRVNLLIHIVAVPFFILGVFGVILSLLQINWIAAIINIVVVILAIAVQGIGHSKETNPAIAFSSPGQALARILSEQFITFPKFVLTGAWYRALKSSAS